jgi:hypothetical protein
MLAAPGGNRRAHGPINESAKVEFAVSGTHPDEGASRSDLVRDQNGKCDKRETGPDNDSDRTVAD